MKWSWVLSCVLLLTACSRLPTSVERTDVADHLATAKDWQAMNITTDAFDLVAYVPRARALATDKRLTLYIEGDGVAWRTRSEVSRDPTPGNPIGLKLALGHPGAGAAYLARPCQYVHGSRRNCERIYWTGARFSARVVAASDQALDHLKAHFQAERITLVGYSGGGAIAALLAAGRDDVDRLITVAGNLDHVAWTRLHHLSPLTASLNPADAIEALARVQQWHFVGAQDENVPPALATSFAHRFPAGRRPEVDVREGFDHRCCWTLIWPELLQQTMPH